MAELDPSFGAVFAEAPDAPEQKQDTDPFDAVFNPPKAPVETEPAVNAPLKGAIQAGPAPVQGKGNLAPLDPVSQDVGSSDPFDAVFGTKPLETPKGSDPFDSVFAPPKSDVSPVQDGQPAPRWAYNKRDPASIRSNNPGAMWDNEIAKEFGSKGKETLNDGLGQGNNVAMFDDPVHGAAAQFALLARKYSGMNIGSAIRRWSGGNDVGEYLSLIKKQTGLDQGTMITPQFLASPDGINLVRAMAKHEAGRDYPLNQFDWQNAQSIGLRGSVNFGTQDRSFGKQSYDPTTGNNVTVPLGEEDFAGQTNGRYDSLKIPHINVFDNSANTAYGTQDQTPTQVQPPKGAVDAQANIDRLHAQKAELIRVLQDPETNHLTGSDIQAKRIELSNIDSELNKAQNPRIEVPGKYYGSQDGTSNADRKKRLSGDYNDQKNLINASQSAIVDQQALLQRGADRVNRLIDLMNQGDQSVVPEYKAMIARIKDAGVSLGQMIQTHNDSVKRFNQVATALNEYKVPTQQAVPANENIFQSWTQSIANMLFSGEHAVASPNNKEGYNAADLAKDQANFVENRFMAPADAISRALGNGGISQEVREMPAVKFSQYVGDLGEYALPIIGAGKGYAGLIGLGKQFVESPAKTKDQFLESISPLSSDVVTDFETGKTMPVTPEERLERTGNLAMLLLGVVGGAKAVGDFASKVDSVHYMTSQMNLPRAVAGQWYDAIKPIADHFDSTAISRFQDQILNVLSPMREMRSNLTMSELSTLETSAHELFKAVKGKDVDLKLWNDVMSAMGSDSMEGRLLRGSDNFKSPEPPKTEPPPPGDSRAQRFAALEIEGGAKAEAPKSEPIKVENLETKPTSTTPAEDAGTSLKTKFDEPGEYDIKDSQELRNRLNSEYQQPKEGVFLKENANGIEVVNPSQGKLTVIPIVNGNKEEARAKAQSIINGSDSKSELPRITINPLKVQIHPDAQYKGISASSPQIVSKETNTTDEYHGVKTYNTNQGGDLLFWEDKAGKTYVMNGHHRLAIANNATDFKTQTPQGLVESSREVSGHVMREADGWTFEKAFAQGVIANLADQKGTAIDAAHALARVGIGVGDLKELGVSENGKVSKHVYSIMKLPNKVLSAAMNQEGLKDESLAGLASVQGMSPEQQLAAVKHLGKPMIRSFRDGQLLGEYIRDAGRLKDAAEFDLFGETDDAQASYESAVAERVGIRQRIARQIAKKYENLVQPISMETFSNENIDAETRKRMAQDLGESKQDTVSRLDLTFKRMDVKKLLADVAQDVADGKKTEHQAAEELGAKLVELMKGKKPKDILNEAYGIKPEATKKEAERTSPVQQTEPGGQAASSSSKQELAENPVEKPNEETKLQASSEAGSATKVEPANANAPKTKPGNTAHAAKESNAASTKPDAKAEETGLLTKQTVQASDLDDLFDEVIGDGMQENIAAIVSPEPKVEPKVVDRAPVSEPSIQTREETEPAKPTSVVEASQTKDALEFTGMLDDLFGEDNLFGGVQEATTTYDTSVEKQGPIGTNDANPARKKLAKDVFVENYERRYGSVLAWSITANWAKGDAAELVGMTLASAKDVATAGQILRDPRVETLRIFAMKGDVVVGQSAVSCRLPSMVTWNSNYEGIRQFLDDLDADGYYVMHNHPSGVPEPSFADQSFTALMAKNVPGFIQHVIIDSNSFGTIGVNLDFPNAGIESKVHKAPFFKGIDPTRKATVDSPLIGEELHRPDQVAWLAKKVQKGDYAVLISMDANLKTSAISEVRTSDLLKETPNPRAAAFISRLRRKSGGATFVAYIRESDAYVGGAIHPQIIQAVTTGLLDDVVFTNSDGQSVGVRKLLTRDQTIESNPFGTMSLGRTESRNLALREDSAYTEDETYKKAKPAFEHFWTALEDNLDIKDFIRQMMERFGTKSAPYLKRFMAEQIAARNQTSNTKEEPDATNQGIGDRLAEDQSVETGTRGTTLEPNVGSEGRSGDAVRGEPVFDALADREDDAAGSREVEANGEAGNGLSRPNTEARPKSKLSNYVISDDSGIGETTDRQKQVDLLAALQARNQINEGNLKPTKAVQDVLARFPGTGWIGNRLNDNKTENTTFRDELKSLLTADEWANLKKSLVNSHYTAIPLVDLHWDIAKRLGFKGGKALETSAGIGYFAGRVPKNTDLTMVEFEDVAADILKNLYPESNVIHAGFETVEPKANHKLAISNIPFDITIHDYNFEKKLGFKIGSKSHNYFFAKALDHVEDGGLIIFTTSSGTLNARDAMSMRTREYLAQHADFIGAIRLPNTAFVQNAGTEVTTDIVILQKRPAGQKANSHEFQNIVPVPGKSGVTAFVNEYFVKHPEMVLGFHDVNTARGRQAYTLQPDNSTPLEQQLVKALNRLPKNILGDTERDEVKGVAKQVHPEPPRELREFRFFLASDNKIYRKASATTSEPVLSKDKPLDKAQVEQVSTYIKLREAVQNTLEVNRITDKDHVLDSSQELLETAYDRYVKKYGKFGDNKIKKILQQDEDYYLVASLELDGGGLAPIFTKRVISYSPTIDKVNNAQDALVASLQNVGRVDLAEMQRVSGLKEDQLVKDLAGIIFYDPATSTYQTADEYGSGNVRVKLDDAKELAAAKGGEKYQANVDFLEKRQPPKVTTQDAYIPFGSKLVEAKDYADFIYSMYGAHARISKEQREEGRSDLWSVDGYFPSELDPRSVIVTKLADGTEKITNGDRFSFLKCLNAAINNQTVVAQFPDVNENGNKTMRTDANLTSIANSKVGEIRDAWDLFWKESPEMSQRITDIYNDKVNVYQYRDFDGSFMTMPGVASEVYGRKFELRPWQKNMIWRTVAQDFSVAQHGVGSGKTFEFIGATRELKRIGKRNKIVLNLLKANKEIIAKDFLAMYPDANILVASESSMDKANRAKFLGRVATGNYDAIIMHHDQFKKIPLGPELQEKAVNDEIDKLRRRKAKDNASDKEIQKAIARLQDKLKSIAGDLKAWQDSGGMLWEDLGIDHIMTDEAHYHKNIPIISDERTLQSQGSAIARDLLQKMDHLRDTGGGATSFSGTMIVNSISETYGIFRYHAPEILKQTGAGNYDDWRAQYASMVTKTERDITGKYKVKTSFFSYNNLPELKRQMRNFTDVQLTKDVAKLHLNGVPVMKLPDFMDEDGNVTGRSIPVTTMPNEDQSDFFMFTKIRAEEIKYPIQPGEDNVLSIATDNRKMSLDARLISPTMRDDPDSKINQLVGKVLWVYKKPEVIEKKGTQIVFLDYGTPKKTTLPPRDLFFRGIDQTDVQDAIKSINDAGYEYDIQENDGFTFDVIPDTKQDFNLYADIRTKLIADGVPENEIAFIHDYNSDASRQDLYAKMNSGEIRILLASTKKGGVGVNVQKRLVAAHNVDAPWTPADYEQRIGRIWRQGNIWDKIWVFDHITVNSFDGFMWNKIAKKQKMIDEIWSPDMTTRSVEDDNISDGEIFEQQAALASGRMDILEYENVKQSFTKLDLAKKSFDAGSRNATRGLQDNKNKIARTESEIRSLRNQDALIKSAFGDKFSGTIDGKTTDSFKEFGLSIIEKINQVSERVNQPYNGYEQTVGYFQIGTAKVAIRLNWADSQNAFEAAKQTSIPEAFLKITVTDPSHRVSFTFEIDHKALSNMLSSPETAATGLTTRIWGQQDHFSDQIGRYESNLRLYEHENHAFETALARKFPKEAEWGELQDQYTKLDATVGVEMRSGEFGQFGSGSRIYSDEFWYKLTGKERLNKIFADDIKAAAQTLAEGTLDSSDGGIDYMLGPNSLPKSQIPEVRPGIVGGASSATFQYESPLSKGLNMVFSPQLRSPDSARLGLVSRQFSAETKHYEAVVAHALSDLRKFFDRKPRGVAHQFIDDIENMHWKDDLGNLQKTPVKNAKTNVVEYRAFGSKSPETVTLQESADDIRMIFDTVRDEIAALTPDQQKDYLLNYFPHIWKDPNAAAAWLQEWINENFEDSSKIGKLGGKLTKKGAKGSRNLEGSRAFQKRRTIPTVAEGLAKGLELVSDNPVDLVMLKLQEMNKFLNASKVFNFAQAEGISLWVPFGQQVPKGFKKVNSTFFDRFSPGIVEVKFAYDKKRLEGILDLGQALDKEPQFKNSAGRSPKGAGTQWAYHTADEIIVRYGANLEAIAHELGHALDDEFKIGDYLLNGVSTANNQPLTEADVIKIELGELAKLRYESIDDADISDEYAKYVQGTKELVANFIHAYIFAPALLKKFAPTALKRFRELMGLKPFLKRLDDLKPGLELTEAATEYRVFGRTYTGSYVLPDAAANLVNNTLSPGLRAHDVALVRKPYEWIRTMNSMMNSFQLGFSAYHGLMTALNAATSDLSAGIGFLSAGDMRNGMKKSLLGLSVVGPTAYGWNRGSKIIDAALSGTTDPKLQEVIKNAVMAGGRFAPDSVYLNNFRRQLRRAWWDIWRRDSKSPSKAMTLARIPWYAINAFNEAFSYWLMESMVPSLKLYAFESESGAELARLAQQKPDFTEEDKRATLARVWDSIDNRFGQLVYDNLFFDNIVKDIGHVSFRALGWDIGSVREVGGAALDAGSGLVDAIGKPIGKGIVKLAGGKPPTGPPSLPGGAAAGPDEPFVPGGKFTTVRIRGTIAGTALIMGISAFVQYILTGKKPENNEDYFFPKTGKKNRDGTDERISFPGYHKDTIHYAGAIGGLAHGNPEPATHVVSGKLAPWIQFGGNMMSNKDFYGRQIADPNDPTWKRVASDLKFFFGEMRPISARNTNQFETGGMTVLGQQLSVARTLGLVPAPVAMSRTPAINKAFEFKAAGMKGATTDDEKFEVQQFKYRVMKLNYDLVNARLKGDTVQIGSIASELVKLKNLHPDSYLGALKKIYPGGDTDEPIRKPIEIGISGLKPPALMEVALLADKDELPYVLEALKMHIDKMKEGDDEAEYIKIRDFINAHKQK